MIATEVEPFDAPLVVELGVPLPCVPFEAVGSELAGELGYEVPRPEVGCDEGCDDGCDDGRSVG